MFKKIKMNWEFWAQKQAECSVAGSLRQMVQIVPLAVLCHAGSVKAQWTGAGLCIWLSYNYLAAFIAVLLLRWLYHNCKTWKVQLTSDVGTHVYL